MGGSGGVDVLRLRRRAALLCVAALAGGTGVAPGAASAKPVSHDVNGDGLADVVFTDYIDSIDSDGATVVFGARDRSAPVSRSAPGERGMRITGDGASLTGAEIIGDVNGDGLADVLASTVGEAYVVYGSRAPGPVRLVRSMFRAGVVGTTLSLPYDEIHGAGDVNGDGLADVVMTIAGRNALASVRFGARTKPLSKGFRVVAGGRVRRVVNPTVAPAGDVNGDGRADVAISVADPNGRRAGFDVEEMVFVVLGKRDAGTVTLTQGRAISSARVRSGKRLGGFAITHARANCWCGVIEMAPAGDLNGDRRGELAITWMDPFKDSRSRADVVFGRRSSTPVLMTGTRASAAAGGALLGIDWPLPLASFGDLDGDGRDDLVAAPQSLAADVNHHAGLQLFSGPSVRGPVRTSAASVPLIGFGSGAVAVAAPSGDVDGDGRADLLVGYEGPDLADPRYAVVYGAATLAPVDVTAASPAATLLP